MGVLILKLCHFVKKKIKPPVLNILKENCYPPSFWAAVIFHVSRKIAKVLALDKFKLKCWKGERILSIVVIFEFVNAHFPNFKSQNFKPNFMCLTKMKEIVQLCTIILKKTWLR